MADLNPNSRADDLEDPDTDRNDVRDEEFEIPDPEQVERDRKRAEEEYGEGQQKNPAA